MTRMKDLTGHRFTRLVVLGFSHRKHYAGATQLHWTCMCDCGAIKTVGGQQLRGGRTKSCGCYRSENTTRHKTKHGMSGTSIYYIWAHLVERCTNPNCERYPSYGGRGIKVHQPWLTFENFLASMGSTWFKGASIERKDVNGNYEPHNCIWIPRNEQSKNRRASIIIESPWGKLNAMYVAKRLGLSPGTFYWRIKRWPKERWFEPSHQ